MGRKKKRVLDRVNKQPRYYLLFRISQPQPTATINSTLLKETISLIIAYEKCLYEYANDALMPHSKYRVMRKIMRSYDRLIAFILQKFERTHITRSLIKEIPYNIKETLQQLQNIKIVKHKLQLFELR